MFELLLENPGSGGISIPFDADTLHLALFPFGQRQDFF